MASAAALAHHLAGHRARAAHAQQRAVLLADRCEGGSTPLLRAATAVALDPLTTGERDIANLAATGATNATIAQTLGLWVRTVETQLQRAYIKLGIHGRAELRAVLQTGQLTGTGLGE